MGAQRIVLGPNEHDYMYVTKVGKQYQLRYQSNRSKAVDLVVGVTSVEGNYEFDVAGAKVDPQGKVSASVNTDKGNFAFDTNGNSNPGQLQVTMTRIDSSGAQTFTGSTALSTDNSVVMNYANWQGEGSSIPTQVVDDNSGTTTTTDMTDTQSTQGTSNQNIGYSSSSGLDSTDTQSSTSNNAAAETQVSLAILNPPTHRNRLQAVRIQWDSRLLIPQLRDRAQSLLTFKARRCFFFMGKNVPERMRLK